MSRFLKYRKLFILIMIALAVITAATAFSVSYAKWQSGNKQLNVGGVTGNWGKVGYEIKFENGSSKDFGKNDYNGNYYTSFTVGFQEDSGSDIKPAANTSFEIVGETTGYTEIINDYSDATDGNTVKDCVTINNTGLKYQTNGAGTYTIEIDTKIKTITFSYIQNTGSNYVHVIEFDDKSSVAFIKDTKVANKYSATFAINSDKDKNFNILQNGSNIDLNPNIATILSNDNVTTEGVSNGFTFKTLKNNGIYTVVIVLELDKNNKITGSTITFTYAALSSTTDSNKAFRDAVDAPGKMRGVLGGSYFGIITSEMVLIPFDTEAKESNYFALSAGEMFAILINNQCIKNGEKTLKLADGVTVGSGSTNNIFTVENSGIYVVTYVTGGNGNATEVTVKRIDQVTPDPDLNVTITYNVDGEVEDVQYYVASGSAGVKNKVADPVKEGYTFKGWYTTATPSATDTPFDFGTVTADSTYTVYAVFEQESAEWKSYQADFTDTRVSDYLDSSHRTPGEITIGEENRFKVSGNVYVEGIEAGLKLDKGDINTQGQSQAVTFDLNGDNNKNTVSFVYRSASSGTVTVALYKVGSDTPVWSSTAATTAEAVTLEDLEKGTYYLGSTGGSARIGDLIISEYVGGSGETPVTPPVGETVSDSIDMTKDTNTSGHHIGLTSDKGYFTVTSTTNYSYVANSVFGKEALVAGGGNRDLTITAGSEVQKIKITIEIGLADGSDFSKTAEATVTYPNGTTGTIASSANANGKYTYSLEIELEAGQSVKIESAKRLAFVGASAEVTPSSAE